MDDPNYIKAKEILRNGCLNSRCDECFLSETYCPKITSETVIPYDMHMFVENHSPEKIAQRYIANRDKIEIWKRMKPPTPNK